jgi:hypothetical protein
MCELIGVLDYSVLVLNLVFWYSIVEGKPMKTRTLLETFGIKLTCWDKKPNPFKYRLVYLYAPDAEVLISKSVNFHNAADALDFFADLLVESQGVEYAHCI